MAIKNYSPFQASFVLASSGTVYSVKTLLNTLTNKPFFTNTPSGVARCAYIKIINDVDNGAAKLYTGTPDLTTNLFGWKGVASQYTEIGPFESNLINLSDVNVLTDTNSAVVSFIIVVR